jgi:hypothetical protein
MGIPLEASAGVATPSRGSTEHAKTVDLDRLSDADLEALLLEKIQRIEGA